MPYRYVDDATTADVAFEAYAETLEELLLFAWEATLELMIEEPQRLRPRVGREISLSAEEPEALLFDLLEELLYYRDSEGLLLRLSDCELLEREDRLVFRGRGVGERLSRRRHNLGFDIKAVTPHQFYLHRIENGWEARVVLDT